MGKAWQIEKALAQLAPLETALSYDNVGFLVGDANKDISRVLLALDITPETVEEASIFGAEMIVSHHPVIFQPYRRITPQRYDTAAAMALIRRDMAAVCMHTNLDLARGGVNDALAQALGLCGISPVDADPDRLLRVGMLPEPMEMQVFARKVCKALGCPGLWFFDAGKPVSRVAVCGGAGGGDGEMELALASGADAYVSSEFRHHITLQARYRGLSLVDAGHFYTERPVLDLLAAYLRRTMPELEIGISVQRGAGSFITE